MLEISVTKISVMKKSITEKLVIEMQSGKITKLRIPGLNAFDFQIKYTETNKAIHWHEIDLHTHNEFELYINLSGDVSFLVENTLYPVSRGDVIIARPGERHHCVYRSDKPHKLFWILFDSQKNHTLLDFMQQDVRENFISPLDDYREELLELCQKLHSEELSQEESLYSFLRIFEILRKSRNKSSVQKDNLPHELSQIMDYINHHIHEELTVKDIASAFYISQSTLERRFKEILHIRPLEFIRRKKLILAAELLQEGKSVLAAATAVGYNDVSYFIELFRQYYGVTPYMYKKNLH